MTKSTKQNLSNHEIQYNLNLLFSQLLTAEKQHIFPTVLSGSVRLEKLRCFLPDAFMEIVCKKSPAYQSWLLNEHQNAGTLFDTYQTLFHENSNQLLQEASTLAHLYFSDMTEEQKIILQDTLKLFLSHKIFKQNKQYCNYFVFYIQTNPILAFSKLVILLCLGSNGEDNLDLIFPAFETHDFDPSMDTIEKQFAFATLCYDNGNHTEAFRLFQELAQEKAHKESIYRTGKMLLIGDGCADVENREQIGFEWLRKNREHPESVYETYLCFLKGIGTSQIYRRAKECLENASRMGVLAAHRDLGMAYWEGHLLMRYERDEKKAYELFQKGACVENPEKGDATCQYMLGLMAEQKNGYVDAGALNWYRQAAKNGSIRAKQRLLDYSAADKQRAAAIRSQENLSLQTNESNDRTSDNLLVFFNSCSKQTFDFIRTLPANKNCQLVFVLPLAECEKLSHIKQMLEQILGTDIPNQNISAVHNISYYAGSIEAALSTYLSTEQIGRWMTAHTEIIFYLFHEDQKQNLSDGLSVLETLKSYQKQDSDIADYMKEYVQVYLLSVLENTNALIDSAINSMQDTYIKVQICHPGIDASRQLLYHKPLFLPCIGKHHGNDMNLVIIGDSRCIPSLIQNMLSVIYHEPGRAVRLSVFSKEDRLPYETDRTTQSHIEKKLRQVCPGIFHYPELVDTELFFFPFQDTQELWHLLSHDTKSFSDLEYKAASMLELGNYFVVACSDNLQTIDIATQLRANLLKYDATFTKAPFIAAYCTDDILACQTEKFIVGNMAYGLDWFNHYDIYCFGSYAELYSYYNLKYDIIRIRGLQLHLSYCENLNDPIAVSNAYQAYYSRSYNRDSSETGILNLTYRAFSAGITLQNPSSYGIPKEEFALASQYEAWLENPDHLETAVRLEHHRWNLFMLTRGFEPATLTQMSTYLHRGAPTHLLQIAKLHPFICKWEDLVDEQDGVQFHLNQVMKTLRPDMEPMNIRKIDTKFITDTAKLLSILNPVT